MGVLICAWDTCVTIVCKQWSVRFVITRLCLGTPRGRYYWKVGFLHQVCNSLFVSVVAVWSENVFLNPVSHAFLLLRLATTAMRTTWKTRGVAAAAGSFVLFPLYRAWPSRKIIALTKFRPMASFSRPSINIFLNAWLLVPEEIFYFDTFSSHSNCERRESTVIQTKIWLWDRGPEICCFILECKKNNPFVSVCKSVPSENTIAFL